MTPCTKSDLSCKCMPICSTFGRRLMYIIFFLLSPLAVQCIYGRREDRLLQNIDPLQWSVRKKPYRLTINEQKDLQACAYFWPSTKNTFTNKMQGLWRFIV